MQLTKEDWFYLRIIFTGNLPLLTEPENFLIPISVSSHSLRFNRFDCYLTSAKLACDPGLMLFGMPGVRSTIWRRIQAVVKSNLIFSELLPASPRAPKTHHYVVNMPGILKFLLDTYALYEKRVAPNSSRLQVGSLLEKSKRHFRQEGWPMVSLERKPTISEGMEDGLRRSEQARKRQRARRDRSPKFKSVWIQSFMKECCEEAGVAFVDVWRDREAGSATYWVEQCELEGKDPRALLRLVCEHWIYFQKVLHHEESGNPIHLPDTVSFSKYFIYRREIESWIALNKEAPRKLTPVTEAIVMERIHR